MGTGIKDRHSAEALVEDLFKRHEGRHSRAACRRFLDRSFITGVAVRVNGRIELHQHNRLRTRTRVMRIELP